MFKRIMLSLAFIGALGAAGLAMPDTAEARWGRRSYYRSYYYPPEYYGRPYPYVYGAPGIRRYYYGPPVYYGGYYGPDYYYGPRSGVYFRFGF